MSEPSPPMFEALLTPYQEQVSMEQSTRFYLFIRDVEIYNEQGDFATNDWQVLLKVSQNYEAAHRKTSMTLMRSTAELVQDADIDTFAQQTASMLIKLGDAINQLNKDMLEQTQQQLTPDGKRLLLQNITPQPQAEEEEETITHWQQIADKEPQLLHKMYKPIFDHMPSQK